MYAPDDRFAVRRPTPPVGEPEADPSASRAASDTDLLDRAEATFRGASEVIDLVERGDLDQAESLLESLVTPSSP